MYDILLHTLDAALRVSTPLIFCAMAGIFSERSGIIDISLEGKLLASAFVAACVAHVSGSAFVALLSAVSVSACLSVLHGFACITHRGNQVVSGLAINILVSGMTVVLGHAWFQRGGQTPTLAQGERFMPIDLPAAEWIGGLPGAGPLYQGVVSGHNLLVYLSFAVVAATAWVLYQTRFGLRLRAVGENPQAVDTAGISVTWLRYRAVIIAGVLCGVGGTYLAIAQNAGFTREMSAGQGYIALAAMVFGNWRPGRALGACLLFGLLDAVAIRLQGIPLPMVGEVPVQLIQSLPYVLTVVLLAGFFGRSIAPRAIGVPYSKDR